MAYWASQPHFLDRDIRFIGPLESAATLGIVKTFRVYKTAPEQASFLEIQHFGAKFLNLVGNNVRWSVDSRSRPEPVLAAATYTQIEKQTNLLQNFPTKTAQADYL